MVVMSVKWHVDGSWNYKMSKPCYHCALFLSALNIKKIIYTNESRQFECINNLTKETYTFSTGTKKYWQ